VAPRSGTPEPTSDVEPRYIKLEDVASYLSVSVPQVYALVRSGELPAIKIGGRGVWRVDRRKLDEYLERLEAETQQWAKAHPLNPRERAQPDAGELE
jgi:excisionase family DNA binding protein